MKNQQSNFRFDHREIAVIFSLFIFVSLLMFTVGILVGKGLEQAKYDSGKPAHRSIAHSSEDKGEEAHPAEGHGKDAGTSITTGDDEHAENKAEELKKEEHAENHGEKSTAPEHEEHAKAEPSHEVADAGHGAPKGAVDDGEEEHPAAHEAAPLDLVPANPKKDKFAGLDEFPKTKESEKILKDPKVAKFLEGGSPDRKVASLTQGDNPKSFPHGKFTVQVASYPNQREALERVESLKKQGFPFAYYSAKEIPGKGTWFRVWLGYFPDISSAQKGGELLITRKEITNYNVRNSENEG